MPSLSSLLPERAQERRAGDPGRGNAAVANTACGIPGHRRARTRVCMRACSTREINRTPATSRDAAYVLALYLQLTEKDAQEAILDLDLESEGVGAVLLLVGCGARGAVLG